MRLVTISDNPLSGTGVAHQMLLILEGILGRVPGVEIHSLSILPHELQQPRPNWRIEAITDKPQEKLLSVLRAQPVDCVLFMIDPRFFHGWFPGMYNEVRKLVPNILYYHVWDNDPPPRFNKPLYDCFDEIACISRLTANVCRATGVPAEKLKYVPHAVRPDIFRPRGGRQNAKRFSILWDSVNLKRKVPHNALLAFSMLNRKHPDTQLVMKTQPVSVYGGNLYAIATDWGIPPSALAFIDRRDIPYEQLGEIYDSCHAVLNTSYNEGFGLSVLQGLYSGCLCICPATGGMTDQVPPRATFGYSVPIDHRHLDNGTECPYIYMDFTKPESIADRLFKAYGIWKNSPGVYEEKCTAAREWALQNFGVEQLQGYFVEAVQKVHPRA